jgi:hypothetical protein
MKILFFVDEDFSPCLEYLKEKKRQEQFNLVLYLFKGRPFRLIIAFVEDEVAYDRFMKVLHNCGIDYVYEMEEVPKVLRYVRTHLGKVVAEAKFT